MKKQEITVGGLYLAKVSGNVVTVRVDHIRTSSGYESRTSTHSVKSSTLYDVTNLSTGRKTTFRSAAKFRGPAHPQYEMCQSGCGKKYPNANKPWTCTDCAKRNREQMTKSEPIGVGGLHGIKVDEVDVARADYNARVQEAIEDAPEELSCTCHPVAAGDGKVYHHADCAAAGGEELIIPFVPHVDSGTDSVKGASGAGDEQRPDPMPAHVVSVQPSTTDSVVDIVCTRQVADGMVSLASKIVAARARREVGTPIAGMTPNDEQELILAAAADIDEATECGRALVIGAGAGTGKTATLKMLEQVLSGRGQYTAFNTALVAESKSKFKKAACNTTHSLAFHAVGKLYQARLKSDRMRSDQIANILRLESYMVTIPGRVDKNNQPIPKTLSAGFLAGQVMVAIKKFCQSADREIEAKHINYIDGIDAPIEYEDEDGIKRTKRGYDNNERVKEYLLPYCLKAWADLTKLDGQLPFSHDVYVKLWQLGTGNDRPIIPADYILLDEAQDTAPVFLDVLMQQKHALLVLVGDDNQQIYEWRGAVNAMGSFPNAPRRLLSQSYRFGQAIADIANTVLAELEVPTDLVMKGNPSMPSRVAPVENPRCYLYRTNAGAIGRVMNAIKEDKRPHLIGGGADVIAWCQAAIDIKAKRGTRHQDLCCFDSWEEVKEYSLTDEGNEIRLMVKLIDQFGAEAIRDALRDMPKEEDADLVISTAHKSKGREWDTVMLGQDFPTANRMTDSDIRLLYVAVTRAKLTLDISQCPPFCGGEEGNGEERRFVPGLRIRWTQEMPTAAEQLSIIMEERMRKDAEVTLPIVVVPKIEGKFTWYKMGSTWCARGPANCTIGAEVKVERRDGTAKTLILQKVMHRYDDAWLYEVG